MNKFLVALLLVASSTLTGCLSYSHHDLAAVEPWPPAAEAHKDTTAYLRLTAQYQFNDKPGAGGIDQPGWEKIVQDSFKESGQLKSVTTQQVDSDLYITATLTNHEQGSLASAFITGFTFFVIPGTFSNTFTLDTVFKDKEGNVLGTITKSERTRTWMQLVFVVAAPFNEKPDRVIKSLSQSTVDEAIKRKLI